VWGEEMKGSRNFRTTWIAQVWVGEKQLRDDRGKMRNQEPALQLRSEQPPHLSCLPVLIYISILCCSLITFPSSETFFCLLLWQMCQLLGLGGRKSAAAQLLGAPAPQKHCG